MNLSEARNMAVKICSCCKHSKPLDDFPKDKSRQLGIHVYCKVCAREKSKKLYEKNVLAYRDKRKQYAIENREASLQRCKTWYQNNVDRVNLNVKKYRSSNKEWYNDYQKKWSDKNITKRRLHISNYSKSEKGKKVRSQQNANRKARMRGAKGNHTLFEWNDLKARFKYSCAHCGISEPYIKLTRDHIIPVSKGGSNYISNIQPLCSRCNSKKKDKL